VGISDIGMPTIVNRAFTPLAIEAGIVPVIRSLIGFGKSKRSLLIDLFDALRDTNPELAASLNSGSTPGVDGWVFEAIQGVPPDGTPSHNQGVVYENGWGDDTFRPCGAVRLARAIL